MEFAYFFRESLLVVDGFVLRGLRALRTLGAFVLSFSFPRTLGTLAFSFSFT